MFVIGTVYANNIIIHNLCIECNPKVLNNPIQLCKTISKEDNILTKINIEIRNLPQIRSAFSQSPKLMTMNLNRAIKQSILFIAGESAKNAPVRTGNLRASMFRPESLEFRNLYGKLQPSPRYAALVHDGVAHSWIIEPRSKKALFWKGASHPMKRVIHPGIKANPFLQKAVTSSQGQVNKFFEEAVQNTLDTIAKESN